MRGVALVVQKIYFISPQSFLYLFCIYFIVKLQYRHVNEQLNVMNSPQEPKIFFGGSSGIDHASIQSQEQYTFCTNTFCM